MAIYIAPNSGSGAEKNASAAGVVIENIYAVPVRAGGYQNGDIVDLGILPAGNSINDWNVILEGAANVDVGILSGTPGSDDASRDLTTVLHTGTLTAGINRAVNGTALCSAFKATGYDRSIGVKFKAAGTPARLEIAMLMVAR